MESDSYFTIEKISRGIYKEKGSRFISVAYPLSDQEKVKPILNKIRKYHHEARHHCYAYMIGRERSVYRANDDGEPSGTAGRPILGQINSNGLTNVLIVVSRYFGGLGRSPIGAPTRHPNLGSSYGIRSEAFASSAPARKIPLNTNLKVLCGCPRYSTSGPKM